MRAVRYTLAARPTAPQRQRRRLRSIDRPGITGAVTFLPAVSGYEKSQGRLLRPALSFGGQRATSSASARAHLTSPPAASSADAPHLLAALAERCGRGEAWRAVRICKHRVARQPFDARLLHLDSACSARRVCRISRGRGRGGEEPPPSSGREVPVLPDKWANLAETHRRWAGCIIGCLLGKFLSGRLRSHLVDRLRCGPLDTVVFRLDFPYPSGNERSEIPTRSKSLPHRDSLYGER